MKNETSKIEAARKAFAAYEEALEALQEAPPTAPRGTTVMTRQDGDYGYGPSHWYKDFKCSECSRFSDDKGWKFCAYCGAEIIRFDHEPDREPEQQFA